MPKSDLEIANAAKLRPILDVAGDIGLSEDDLDLYGRHKAKVHLDVLNGTPNEGSPRYVIVTAMTPTKQGEGKTVTTVGLAQALAALGHRTVAALRQPSQGPTFGLKGGAAGGGYAQVVPMVDLNLHLTGDIHAVSAAHNLLAAAIDSRIYHEARLSDKRMARSGLKRLNIDPDRVTFRRVVDVDDRALRSIALNESGADGETRSSGYDITAASEVMAILALTTGRADLRQRLGRIVIGLDKTGKPVTAEDLGAAGAMAALMRDAIMPTLMQTLEGTPVLVHAGPFANIAHGNSSVLADRIALNLLGDGYLVTEAGFGADCGFEKFSHIKCRTSGLRPDCAVVVATVKALKEHGGLPTRPSQRPPLEEQMPFLEKGMANLEAHVKIVGRFGIPAVVAINRFPEDTDAEIECVRQGALAAGAGAVAPSEVWADGGEGGADLARAVVEACDAGNDFHYLYELDAPLEEKIETLASQVYGAAGVEYSDLARERIEDYRKLGFGGLPVIMAKTPASLSHDPTLKGAPTGFTMPVRDVRLSAGAGFLYALCGDIMTMPGLPSVPAFTRIDIDETGEVSGLS
ncbi:MAG: formate--tetrahydrofolate ligase [Gemmatimonadetes bacterium]|mgnify:CR=1 FL=1|jgi:methylenetetrahydrofolate dehydrogenase (NADP+) / methenyltetrahydrofolate cyclohydrolase / formyltetrahydrofolate synthetase|nr:formate--tetrahydrofolate ligase [Gemmatimonadota bacterium]MBT6147006.1 formate--tetrahydrofolate ligase [Gemmatimonadota bacterium]MBT7860329.1 formate--tetrahydrofolate ligase [Gemmatimonadota bacterium]